MSALRRIRTWGTTGVWLGTAFVAASAGVAQERIATSDGVVAYVSDVPFVSTVGRVQSAVTSRGLYVMQVLDHTRAAAQLGYDIGPNTVVLFGNPEVGAQVMTCAPRAGIDLPQKLHVWEEGGMVLVGYNDPSYLVRRHSIEGCDELIDRVAETLDSLARDVAWKE
ncbi:MAG: DUF302 domain-containing protein [Candidatus Palauibacterales bacterium]|nr:DUF302 domain-containing protein [Candidatus Palauibacterales bacterium]